MGNDAGRFHPPLSSGCKNGRTRANGDGPAIFYKLSLNRDLLLLPEFGSVTNGSTLTVVVVEIAVYRLCCRPFHNRRIQERKMVDGDFCRVVTPGACKLSYIHMYIMFTG